MKAAQLRYLWNAEKLTCVQKYKGARQAKSTSFPQESSQSGIHRVLWKMAPTEDEYLGKNL